MISLNKRFEYFGVITDISLSIKNLYMYKFLKWEFLPEIAFYLSFDNPIDHFIFFQSTFRLPKSTLEYSTFEISFNRFSAS